MKNTFLSIFLLLFFSSCAVGQNSAKQEELQVNTVLDAWHKAAADAQFETYFDLMSPDAIFIGTDASENWNKINFKAYAKPHFDKGKAWSFTAIERHVFFDKTGKFAWFDELLNTQMKVCRGSGVLVKTGGKWKIQQYVLSMTIPNENANEVIKIKTPLEDIVINKLKEKAKQ